MHRKPARPATAPTYGWDGEPLSRPAAAAAVAVLWVAGTLARLARPVR